jgi:hypothetical protein
MTWEFATVRWEATGQERRVRVPIERLVESSLTGRLRPQADYKEETQKEYAPVVSGEWRHADPYDVATGRYGLFKAAWTANGPKSLYQEVCREVVPTVV